MIINLISGPRNISTALMYSFAQRSDTKVVDEPFYAHYLSHTGLKHPGREEVLQSMHSDPKTILENIYNLETQHEIVFLKNMAHHHEGLDWSYLGNMVNFFLIRDPKQLIASFSQVIHQPTIQDIGLKLEAELLDYLLEKGSSAIVLDSNSILPHPERGLTELCSRLNIPFQNEMLKWSPGPIPEDGSWAKYWYKNVHNSSGFTKQKSSERELPEHCLSLYEDSIPYFERLKKHLITI